MRDSEHCSSCVHRIDGPSECQSMPAVTRARCIGCRELPGESLPSSRGMKYAVPDGMVPGDTSNGSDIEDSPFSITIKELTLPVPCEVSISVTAGGIAVSQDSPDAKEVSLEIEEHEWRKFQGIPAAYTPTLDRGKAYCGTMY